MGQVLKYWPIIIFCLTCVGFVYNKLSQHDTRLAVLDQEAQVINANLGDLQKDMKTLLRRSGRHADHGIQDE